MRTDNIGSNNIEVDNGRNHLSTFNATEDIMIGINEGQQPKSEDLSFAILWSPLHPITTLLPFIGHMGIADSQGHSHDFQGPYYVGTDGSQPVPRMAFGKPTRYLKLDIGELPGGSGQWDEAILEADRIYRQRMHNLCCDNCHSHVAKALNIMEYKGRHDWDMVKLCFLVFFKGSFVNVNSLISQFAPFFVVLSMVLVSLKALT